MSTLTKKQIIERLEKGELLTNARKLNDTYDVQAASYDLAIGVAVSKRDKKTIFQKRTLQYVQQVFEPENKKQETVTLGPGQMIYVIAHEEIAMPKELCGTVYSRNSLALDGILALNTGHIDPGYHGPITIKLINLRSTDWTFPMGKAIFTIAFHTLNDYEEDKTIKYKQYTKAEILEKVFKATDVSLNNALYDLALLREFVKEDEFGRALKKWLFKTVWGVIVFIFTSVFALIGICATLYKFLESIGLIAWAKALIHNTPPVK
jgi:deoxycytidine triphosphate deaminase